MKKRDAWKIFLALALIGVSIWLIYPPFEIKGKDGSVVKEGKIKLGLDLKGGMHLLLKVDASRIPENAREDATERAIEVIRNRIDQFGVREPSIQKQGKDEIIVQLPGVTDRDRALGLIGKTALLEFKVVSDDAGKLKEALSGNVPDGYELSYATDDNEPMLLEKEAVLTGEALSNATIHFEQSRFNEPQVGVEFNPEGAKRFARLTSENVGRRLAIILDGKVQSAPVIREEIPSGQAVISGRFTVEEAKDLSLILRTGALPAPMYIEEERTIGPLLGQDSINKGLKASLVGIGLIFVFMIIYYLVTGLVASVALLLNFLFTFGCLALLPYIVPGVSATLTLPGIAGIALSLGMAVDANVLINERIREELSAGKPFRQAITLGYDKAFSAILDSNLTTLIAALFLFQFGTGPIRGFAVTLTIGLVASMFTAIVVTRVILESLADAGILKSLPMLKLIKATKIDFIGKRRIFYVVSLLVICVGLVSFFGKKQKVYGIDFSGGQLQEYIFKTTPDIVAVRKVLREMNLGDASIQQIKDNPRILLIKTAEEKSTEMTSKLKEVFPDQDIQILRIEHVGPVAGKHLKTKAFYAIIWSMIGILVYVAFRFKHFNFALAGVIALLHDVLVALGALALTNRTVDLLTVTAFLTIAGYSINDTIVIYDRVRENMRLNRKLSLAEIINLSVNQTLARTILTSGVTLMVVIAILFYGGEVLSDFAFTLLVGFISGIYSTVYIASPLVLAFQRKKK